MVWAAHRRFRRSVHGGARCVQFFLRALPLPGAAAGGSRRPGRPRGGAAALRPRAEVRRCGSGGAEEVRRRCGSGGAEEVRRP